MNNKSLKYLFYGLPALLIVILIILSYLRWPLWPDHSFYLYMGESWQKGLLPYKDIFDQNWQGVTLISQMITALFGSTPFGVRLFDTIWQILTGTVLYFIARKYLPRSEAFTTIVFYLLIYLASSYGTTAQREGFASLFLGIALFLVGFNNKYSYLLWMLAGLLLSFSAIIKPVLLIIPLLLFIYCLHKIFIKKEFYLLLRLGCLCLGVIIPLGYYFYLLVYYNILFNFFDATILYTSKYANLNFSYIIPRLLSFVVFYPPGRLIIICLFLSLIAVRYFRKLFVKYDLLTVFTFGSLLNLLIQQRISYNHSLPFCFFGTIYATVLLKDLRECISLSKFFKKLSPKKLTVFSMLLLFIMIFPIGYDLPASIKSVLLGQSASDYGDTQRVKRNQTPWSVVEIIGDVVQKTFLPDVRILVISGTDSPDFYLESGRMPAQKYIDPARLVHDKTRVYEMIDKIKNDERPIAMIVNSKSFNDDKSQEFVKDFYKAAIEGATLNKVYQLDLGANETINIYSLQKIK